MKKYIIALAFAMPLFAFTQEMDKLYQLNDYLEMRVSRLQWEVVMNEEMDEYRRGQIEAYLDCLYKIEIMLNVDASFLSNPNSG